MESKSHFEDSPRGSDDESGMTLLGEQLKAAPVRRSIFQRALKGAVVAAALVCAVSVLYTAVAIRRLSSLSAVDFGDCGESRTVEEARAMGCKFDPMSWIWVRPECYDAELIADFMNKTDFSWHTEPKLTPESKVPMDIIFRGDHPKLFTQKNYHSVHCTYMMKKMHKAILEHRPIDTYLMDWVHTNHCEMVLLNDWMHEDTPCTPEMVCPTWVRATWTACKRY